MVSRCQTELCGVLHRLGNGPVLIAHAEGRTRREISGKDLRDQVVALAIGLKQAGGQPGDRVAAIVANCPEAIIALLLQQMLWVPSSHLLARLRCRNPRAFWSD